MKRLVASLACFLIIAVLSAQNVDRTVVRAIEDFFANYKSETVNVKNCRLERKRNNIRVNNKSRTLTIYANDNFAKQIFTAELVDEIYSEIRKLLPKSLRKYKIEVIADRKPIEQLISNINRSKGIAPERMWGGIDYKGEPWVRNLSKPYTVSDGLAGRHLAVWQSHGRIYSNDKGVWQWQRPALYCTTEDLFTQSVVVPFLMPMLENAGAYVYTPRERDWQPNCVIVDNDAVTGASQYLEGRKNRKQWDVCQGGYLPHNGEIYDGENLFTMGTSRSVESSSEKKGATAIAMWRPEIPEDGNYAVYVSYKTSENAIPDARYSILHSGGVTEYNVNQQMGGGTWVYLGTFHFKKGAHDNQGVKLSNISNHAGVVSADAVRFGGGMGVVARGDSIKSTSGMPRYLEGARYALQLSGFPYEVYSPSDGERDYNDDINSRSHALNYLSGGSIYNPDTTGLKVPFELTFGFHSDAGISADDEIIGSLGIATTEYNGDTIEAGLSRYISRDMIGTVLESVQRDISARYGIKWTNRGIFDKNYSESRIPVIPSMIFESLSHQNFADMIYGHDPDFKFTMARAVYKALLRQITFLHGCNYVVQPLPVKDFSVSFIGGNDVQLRWNPVPDDLEPTAMPEKYILYTKAGDGGFDNGRLVESNSCKITLLKDVQYSFKVTALNDGGESFPSEVLSAYLSGEEKGRIMIVNGFHRLSAPEVINTSSRAGFNMDADPGVAYMATPEYCGRQLDYERDNIGYEEGLGLSGNDFEGMLIAGNSFNYPYIHGKALAANGFSYVSCSSEAVVNGLISLSGYDAVDLILGVEKQGGRGSLLCYNRPYKTFPKELQAAVTDYCRAGGRLFVSGAYVAGDMSKNATDRDFIRNILHVDYGGSVSDASDNVIYGSGLRMNIHRNVNEQNYTVTNPDILIPMGKDAFVSFVYDGCKESAGVAYAGGYRVLTSSFPFESIADEKQRSQLMGAVMRFLLNK